VSGYRIEGPSAVLTGPHLEAVQFAVQATIKALRARGDTPPRALLEAAELLDPPAPRPGGDTPKPHTGHAVRMSTQDAARDLGMSPRNVRRRASELGGEMVAGVLLLDADAVRELAILRTKG